MAVELLLNVRTRDGRSSTLTRESPWGDVLPREGDEVEVTADDEGGWHADVEAVNFAIGGTVTVALEIAAVVAADVDGLYAELKAAGWEVI